MNMAIEEGGKLSQKMRRCLESRSGDESHARMDLLAAYDSGSGSEGEEETKATSKPVPPSLVPKVLQKGVNAAPFVNPALNTIVNRPTFVAPGKNELTTNLPAATLLAPVYGPAHPHRNDMAGVGGKKLITGGYMEPTAVEAWNFHEQFHTFHAFGYAQQMASGQVVGDVNAYRQQGGATVLTGQAQAQPKTSSGKGKKRKLASDAPEAVEEAERDEAEDLGDEDELGPWGPVKTPQFLTDAQAGTLTDEQRKYREEFAASQAAKGKEFNIEEFEDRRDERKISHLLPARHDRDSKAAPATTKFHGKAEKDYQGRSWVEPPAGLRPDDGDHQCFLPTKCVHKYSGHTKGVQCIEFMPVYGHLLLSGSMDGTVKIWDVYNERYVKRTYSGHSQAVRCINFNNDGSQFVTGSFDRYMRLWDTETGQCISTFCNRKVPYCVKFYPVDNKIFCMGSSDNKIIQWDTSSGEVVQEYNHHLGPVNTVTFYDDSRRFGSTSDDKKMLLWEWNIPVPIKYIAEPSMHSMPAVTTHPSGHFMACQSLDNTIRVFATKDRFKQLHKKVFKGHMVAGYACQPAFSANGKFLVSGDGDGKVFCWDWKNTRLIKKFKAHDNGPTIGSIWHPIEPSCLATCGWDGLIKLWN